MITQTLDLNLIPGRVLPMVNVSQYDKDSRTLEFTIYNGDQTFDLTGLSAYIQGLKPDGHGFNYSANISAGKITADITEQMTAVSGRVMCEVIIMDGTDRIGTGNFILNVEAAAMPDGSNMSASEYSYIEELIEDAQAAQTAAEESAEDAEAWAVGKRNGTDVPATDPTYQNNAKYYADQAQIYAQGALKYKGSVLFANIPTTGMTEGDMYNIEDDFTTDNRFQEGAGIEVAAGSNIAWNANSKWDVLTVVAPGVASFNGRTGAVTPASGDYDITDISATGGSEGQIPMVDSNGDLALTDLPDTDTKSAKGTSFAELTSAGNALPLAIYGQSTQNGTPTPSAPVAIESASADFKCVGKNLIHYPYKDTTKTVNGITFTDNGDGTITVSGTANADYIQFSMHLRGAGETNDWVVKNGTYILSGCPSGGGVDKYSIFMGCTKNGGWYSLGRDAGNGGTIVLKGDDYSNEEVNPSISIEIRQGQSFNPPITFKPMLRLASVADATYEPYKHTDIYTDNYGSNIVATPFYNTTKTSGGITYTDNNDGTVTVSGTATADSFFGIRSRTEYGTASAVMLQNKEYRVTGCPKGGSPDTYNITVARGDTSSSKGDFGMDVGDGFNFVDKDASSYALTLNIIVKSGTVFSSPVVFKPEVREVIRETLRSIEVTSSDPYNLVKDGHYYIADTIDWDEVDGYTLTKRIEHLELLNTMTWSKASTINAYYTTVSDFDKTLRNVKSNRFVGTVWTGGSFPAGDVAAFHTSLNSLYFRKDDITNVNDWKTWLGSNPLYADYILATPTKTPITSAQAKALLSMRTYDESTSIDAVNAPAPVLELEYAKTRTPALALTGHNMAHINAIDIGDM